MTHPDCNACKRMKSPILKRVAIEQGIPYVDIPSRRLSLDDLKGVPRG